MALTVEWTEPADKRLGEIFDYLKGVAGVRTAQKIVGRIGARPRILAANPQAGPREELLSGRPEEFRYLVEGNYKIVYYATDEKVFVSAVFDCRQDPARLRDEVPK
jgi:plasmid stabilization system protein ParE